MKNRIIIVGMTVLLRTCAPSIAVDRTSAIDVGAQQQCSSPNGTGHDKSLPSCRDFEKMSVLVADLVGRSVGGGGGGGGGGGRRKSTDSPFNVSTKTLIRAASGAVGRGADALKTVVVNGLVLLTETIVGTMTDRRDTGGGGASGGDDDGCRPIDWISNNPYIKSLTGEAVDDTLADRLETSAAGMPCVQLLLCRLSPVVRYMQRLVKGRRLRASWTASDWRRLGDGGCAQKFADCAKAVGRDRTPAAGGAA